MSKSLRHIKFLFDYYIGYYLVNPSKIDSWCKSMMRKYPEKFNNKK